MANYDDEFDDFDEFDDDFDSEADDAADEDINQRLDAFEKQVERNRKIIMSPKSFNASQRMEAVRWLGEAGAITAIPDLTKVYERDKTSGMKDTAAYALGQLKALELALEDTEVMDETYDLLERVQLYGELGKRVNRTGALVRQAGLVVSAVVLFILALFVPTLRDAAVDSGLVRPTDIPPTATTTATATPDTPEIALEALVEYYTALENDANALSGQLSLITRAEPQACDELANNFNNPADYTLSDQRTEANLTQIAQQLNEASSFIDPVREAFNDSCATGVPISREQALNEYFDSIVAAQRLLRDSVPLFEGNAVELPPTPTNTPEPTAAPTATPDLTILRPHIQTLEIRISDMTGLGSPTSLLTSYWNAVDQFGGSSSLEGCLQTRFIIPNDYEVPLDLQTEFPLLQQAAENVNLGLLLIRQSNETFFSSCERNQFPGDAVTWAERTETAVAAFEEAQSLINELTGQR